MKPTSSKNHKIPLSLDPAYQLIWCSLIWFFLFIAIFSASTYRSWNWITPITVLLAVILVLMRRGTYARIDPVTLTLCYFSGLKKSKCSMTDIKMVHISEDIHFIQLFSDDGTLLESFYLSKKQQKAFAERLPQKVVVFIQSQATE